MADTSQDQKEESWAGAPPPSSLEPGRPGRGGRGWIALLLAALAVGGAYLGWRQLSQVPAAAPPPRAAADPIAAPEPAGPAPEAASAVLSATERSLLDGVSDHPAFRRWLDEGDAVNRWALVVANLAEGVVPRKALAFLAPTRPFEVGRHGGQAYLSETACRRYDLIGDVVASVNPSTLAVAYRAFHQPLEAAYRALGDPKGSLDAAVAKALDRLSGAPVLEQEPEVVPGPSGALWVFKEPRLEGLGPVEKQLLRFGPRTGRLVKSKAAAIRNALNLGR